MRGKATREQIVAAADGLFYRKGFEHTSFSDIAEAVGISRGNFYFHFQTKDEILGAVIRLRLGKTEEMLKRWEEAGEGPEERIRSFINILITNGTKIRLYGCPVGTLCTELGKLKHPAQGEAKEVFTMFRKWLRRQFQLLGREDDADRLAMQVLARSQGVATLGSAFRDERFIRQEVEQMHAWLDGYLGKGGGESEGSKEIKKQTQKKARKPCIL